MPTINNLTYGIHWNLTETVAPAAEPVSLAEAKIHLRQDFPDDDDLITTLIAAARQHVSMVTRRAFVNTTYTLKLDEYPTEIWIPVSPLSSVTSITYIDTNGNSQTEALSVYSVDTDTEPGRISQAFDQSWSDTRDQNNAITVTFISGYGAAASDVPETFKASIKLLVGHWYQSREAVAVSIGGNIVEIPLALKMLLDGQRVLGAA